MVNKNIIDNSLADAKAWGNAQALDDGLVLVDRVTDSSESHTPQRMNFILMALCRQGECHYSIDTREQTAKSGDLFFISDRHIVDYFKASPDFDCMAFALSTEFYHSFVLNVKNVSSLLLFSTKFPVVQLRSNEIRTYENFFRAISERISNKEHPFRVNTIKALLLAMFYDMSGVIWRVEQQTDHRHTRAEMLFSKFIRLLEENYRQERRVGWYATQLNISPKYLSEVVKLVSKHTPNDWIDHYVILELRVMLKNSSKSIKEITEEMNFPNQSFLGKYFKEHVGLSPSEFRRS
jgi:AraC-like DNA-binding protein